jgi:creatinine amidohydrolase
MQGPASRMIGHLVFSEVDNAVEASSVLCLPMGSIEQHGPHLPLNTDCVIAEALTRRIVARWGDEHDLWQLPVVPVGLSREHAWAPGTLSLTVSGMAAYLRDIGSELVRALPARNLLIVNGHGGNRGILEAVTREMRDFGLNIATLHLGALMSPDAAAADVPEIHAGKDETSVMLVLAPE